MKSFVAMALLLVLLPSGALAQTPEPAPTPTREPTPAPTSPPTSTPAPAPPPSPAAAPGWAFSLTPYLWLPNIDGTLAFSVPPGDAGAPEVGVGPNDYLSNLSFVLMLAGEARNGRWAIATDVVYLDFSGEDGSVKSIDFGGDVVSTDLTVNNSTSFTGLAWTLVGGYAVVSGPRATLELLGGVRYLGVEASSDWTLSADVEGPGEGDVFPATGSIEEDRNLWDALVGVRGTLRLGDAGRWSIPYYLDAGTGSSALTWQGVVGIAYGFEWGDLRLAYRHLSYDEDDGKLLQDLRFSGPALGATFRF